MDRFKNHLRILTIIAIFTLAWSINSSRGLAAPMLANAPVSTAFAYPGFLFVSGSPATGVYDLEFRLFDAASAGVQVGTPQVKEDVRVRDGHYTVDLDFGASPFTGSARWLEVGWRAGTSIGAFTVVTPRALLTGTPYALSLRPGAQIIGSTGVGGASLTTRNTGAGVGLWGRSVSNAAVYGQSTNSTGVLGDGAAAGVRGRSTAGRGVVGESQTSNGVYGETAAAHTATLAGVYGKSTGAGGIGVIGEARTGNTWGVYGITDNGVGVVGAAGGSGVGVSGSSTFGYAMQSEGHATQSRGSNGWVKAMAYINPFLPADRYVVRCYNSQLPAASAAGVPCGITVTRTGPGKYIIDFGFQVTDRFAVVSPVVSDLGAGVEYFTDGPTRLEVYMSDDGPEERWDGRFTIVVY